MLKKIKEKNNIQIILIYVGVLIIYHLLMRDYAGDTYNFYNREMGGPTTLKRILEIMHDSYYGLNTDCTSRILVEVPLFILANGMHVVLWSIANIILHVMMFVSFMKITDFAHNKLLLCLMLMYPVYDMCNAGWMTAYISYLWPLALGVVSMVSLKKMYEGEKIKPAEFVFYVLCQIYSTNLEICAAIYFMVLVLFIIAMTTEHKWNGLYRIYTVVETIISIGAFIFIFTCPGNYTRTASDIKYWFPDFRSLTFVDKVVLSTNALISELINNSLLWVLMCALLLVIVILKYRDNIRLITLAAIPVAASALRTVLRGVCDIYMPQFSELFDLFSATSRVDATNYNSFASYFPFIYYMTVMVIVAYIMITISKDALQGLSDVYLLVAGLLTRLSLAFAPSVYASGRRTMIVIDYMLIYLMVRLYSRNSELVEGKIRFKEISRILVYLLTIFVVISGGVAICFEYYYGYR
ncbi:MAG: hypothetical protein K5868_05150 [Lachnospiraceae bacterium]|nr:hypothetical protein [Lachnospiraceae bacterium]